MAIYKIKINNDIEKYITWIAENFDNENEISKFKTEVLIEGDEVLSCEIAYSLADLIANFYYSDRLVAGYNDVVYYYNRLVDQFGIDKLKNQFPDEMLNFDQLMARAQEMCDKMEEKLYAEFTNSDWEEIEDDTEKKFDNYQE